MTLAHPPTQERHLCAKHHHPRVFGRKKDVKERDSKRTPKTLMLPIEV
jgi:hypothetical protein